MSDPSHPTRPSPTGTCVLRATAVLVLAAAALLAGPAAAGEDAGDDLLRIGARIRAHTPWVRCLAWSPDGRTLASGGNDRAIRIWEPSAAEPVAEATVERDAHGDP